jgi:molybdopterin converting factor small subunit
VLVTVLLFARPREVVGSGRVQLDLSDGATAGGAFDALVLRAPALAPMRRLIRCAVDGEYTEWDALLSDGCELALIPPTAGG